MQRVLISLLLIIFTSILTPITPVYAASFADRADVQLFINKIAKQYGFKKEQLNQWFSTVKLRPQLIMQFIKPVEKETWSTYQMIFVSEWRIKHGIDFWNTYAEALKKAEKTYGVPASIIVATIGIETKYGQKTGDYRVIDSLSNVAFSPSPRAAYFRKELEEFLLLTREEHLDPLKILGSYAGAIGQPQFMPSSYRKYAVNFSNSGKTDLMTNEIDIIGSIANYYHKKGWQLNKPVAAPIMVIGERYNYLLRNHRTNQFLPIGQLLKFGVIPKNKLPPDDMLAKIIPLQGYYNKEYWLGFHNFDVIKRYNASDLYAMAVYQLSRYLAILKEKNHNV